MFFAIEIGHENGCSVLEHLTDYAFLDGKVDACCSAPQSFVSLWIGAVVCTYATWAAIGFHDVGVPDRPGQMPTDFCWAIWNISGMLVTLLMDSPIRCIRRMPRPLSVASSSRRLFMAVSLCSANVCCVISTKDAMAPIILSSILSGAALMEIS